VADAAPLDPEALESEAREGTGLGDFGGGDFREGLAVLCETYEHAGLKESGRQRTRARLLHLLQTRLRIAAAFERHPEIRTRPIRRPVYLTGLPRTGTSALFNLLGADPAARPLRLWEGMSPDVPPDFAPGREDPRLTAWKALHAQDSERNREFAKIHHVDPEGPEECVLLLAYTFRDVQMGIEPLMEPYGSWFQKQDLRPSYDYYLDLLRMLDFQRPGDRWLLKSPAHLWALDILVERLPDACILWTHRNPLEIIPSYCSMMRVLMNIRESVDPRELGPTVLEYLARSLERGLAARDRLDPDRFVDVDYRRFVADPLGTAEAIYRAFELPLPEATRRALREHVQAHPQGRHGRHEYSLEEYGLSPGQVRERLRFYTERFEVPTGA